MSRTRKASERHSNAAAGSEELALSLRRETEHRPKKQRRPRCPTEPHPDNLTLFQRGLISAPPDVLAQRVEAFHERLRERLGRSSDAATDWWNWWAWANAIEHLEKRLSVYGRLGDREPVRAAAIAKLRRALRGVKADLEEKRPWR